MPQIFPHPLMAAKGQLRVILDQDLVSRMSDHVRFALKATELLRRGELS